MYKQNIEELQKTALFLKAKIELIDLEIERRTVVSEEIASTVLMVELKKKGAASSSTDTVAKKAAISTDSQIY